jgi:hypothetical protein
MRFVREVTAESYPESQKSVSQSVRGNIQPRDPTRTYNAVAHNARHRRSHVDTVPHDEECGQNFHLVFEAGPLPPCLLVDYPDVGRLMRELAVRLRGSLKGII